MISWFNPKLFGNEKKYVNDAIDSGWISDGNYVNNFENKFGQSIGSKYVVSVSNGTSALYCALLSLGIGKGDQVIVSGYSFAAPVNMVLAVGAKPVFADVDPRKWQISTSQIEAKISDKTKAIIAVHNYGNMADMPNILEIAKKYNLKIIEDTAEATFSKIDGKNAGTYGDLGCYSFQATKLITTGEGGAVVTDCSKLFDRATLFRNHGMRPQRKYFHEVAGHNFRLTNFQAAFGLAQLENKDDIISNKMRIDKQYKDELRDISQINFQQSYDKTEDVIWAFAVCLSKSSQNDRGLRDRVRERLKEVGIETRGGFLSFEEMPLYNLASESIPNSLYLSKNIISFPSYIDLTTKQISFICDQFKRVLKEESVL